MAPSDCTVHRSRTLTATATAFCQIERCRGRVAVGGGLSILCNNNGILRDGAFGSPKQHRGKIMRSDVSPIDAAVYLALAAGGFGAASWTGSAAVQAAAIACLAAGSSAALLLPSPVEAAPGRLEPLYGSHVAAILLFALGAGLAAAEGFDRLPNGLPGAVPFSLPPWLAVGLGFGVGASGIIAMDTVPGEFARASEGPDAGGPEIGGIGSGEPGSARTVAAKRGREAWAVFLCFGLAVMVLAEASDGVMAVGISLVMALVAALTAVELKAMLRQADLPAVAAAASAGDASPSQAADGAAAD